MDKLNTDTDCAEVEKEAEELRVQNDSEAKEVGRSKVDRLRRSWLILLFAWLQVEVLFAEKQEREVMIAQLEREIEQEQNMADNLISAMQPELRERYMELKTQNMQYQVREWHGTLFQVDDPMVS